MPAAARVRPADFFTDAEWATLSRRSHWRGLLLVAHCWGLILLAGAAFVLWPNPLTFVLAVMIIGARQLGLAILVHEAAHGALHRNLKVNDWVAEWLCGAPVGSNLAKYRPYHLQHHRYAQQAEDPDLGLSAPFPTTRSSLRRKIVRDLTGQTFYKQRVGPLVAKLRKRGETRQPIGAIFGGEASRQGRFLLWNLGLLAALTAAGLWWAYFVLWLLPMATWFPLVTRLRNIAEHACVAENEPDPLRHARTTRASWWERLLIAPYYVNYHAEHHMFMHLPCWSLPRAHRLLERKGVVERMETADGYFQVLKRATMRPEPAAAVAA